METRAMWLIATCLLFVVTVRLLLFSSRLDVVVCMYLLDYNIQGGPFSISSYNYCCFGFTCEIKMLFVFYTASLVFMQSQLGRTCV